jgi:hypothetical protein
MPDQPRTSAAPLIAAVITGIAAIALAVVYFVAVRSDDDSGHSGSGQATGDFSATERKAMAAAATEATNVQSLRRAHYDADFNRALAGMTGGLRSDWLKNKASYLSTLKSKKVDLRSEVTHTALIGPTDNGKGYDVLVTMLGYAYSGSKQALPTPQRLQVTVVDVKGKWLASDISQRGL